MLENLKLIGASIIALGFLHSCFTSGDSSPAATPPLWKSYRSEGGTTERKRVYLDNLRFKGDAPVALDCYEVRGEVKCDPVN